MTSVTEHTFGRTVVNRYYIPYKSQTKGETTPTAARKPQKEIEPPKPTSATGARNSHFLPKHGQGSKRTNPTTQLGTPADVISPSHVKKPSRSERRNTSVFALINQAIRALDIPVHDFTCGGLPINSAAARKCKLTTAQLQRLKYVRLNWTAIQEALELVYGQVRTNVRFSNNRRIISKMYRFVRGLVFSGLHLIKSTSHAWREKSVGLTVKLENRGKVDLHLFLASTLARACVMPPPTKEEEEQQVHEALQRLTEPSPMPTDQTLAELSRFIGIIFGSKTRHNSRMSSRPFPEPASTAAYGDKGQGTNVYQYLKYTRAERLGKARKAISERLFAALAEAGGIRPESWNNIALSEDILKDEEYYQTRELIPLAESQVARQLLRTPRKRPLSELFPYVAKHIAPTQRVCSITPIHGADGKIRVITVHHNSVSWCARAMSHFLFPLLKDLVVTRDILRDREVTLIGKHPSDLLYSADLSKATDPISIPLSRFVLTETVKHTGKPAWFDDAMNATIATHKCDTPDGNAVELQCGALMGLGPGWFVLCVLNAFCAWRAGATKRSFAVCGDDLIGLWSQTVIDRYETMLERLGLKANKAKSFRSERAGVFCERFVRRTGPDQAKSEACLRLGEAVAMKARANRTDMTVVDSLSRDQKGPLSELGRRTAARIALRGNFIPGAMRDGGCGRGKPTAATVAAYFLYGPLNLVENLRETDKRTREKTPLAAKKFLVRRRELCTDVRRSTRSLRPTGGNRQTVVPAIDVLIETRRRLRCEYIRDYAQDPFSSFEKVRKYKDLSKECGMRNLRVRQALAKSGGLSQLINDSCTSNQLPYVFLRPRLLCGLRHFIRQHDYKSCLRLLRKSWAVRVPVEDALQLVDTLPIRAIGKEKVSLHNANLAGW